MYGWTHWTPREVRARAVNTHGSEFDDGRSLLSCSCVVNDVFFLFPPRANRESQMSHDKSCRQAHSIDRGEVRIVWGHYQIGAKVAAGGGDYYGRRPPEITASPQPRAQPISARYCDVVPSARSAIVSRLYAPV